MTFLGSVGDAWERNVAGPWRESGIAGDTGYGTFKTDQYKINEKAFSESANQKADRSFATNEAKNAQKRTGAQMQGAQVNMAPQDQFRSQEMTLAGQLADQAAGRGPSLAQSQLRQATDRNIAQQMALASSGRGGANPLQARQLAQNIAQANQQAASQSADLRMQEQMAARQQLGSLLGQGRQADIGLAQNQAALNQQAGMQNQASEMQQRALNDAQQRYFSQARFDSNNQAQANQMALETLKTNQNLGINTINSGAYQNAAAANRGLTGGIISGIASGFGLAEGGMVPPAPSMAEAPKEEKPKEKGFMDTAGEIIKKGVQSQTEKAPGQDAPEEKTGSALASMLAEAAGAMMASGGGKVPGRAMHKGDSYKNDKVPAMLSPGEIVVPRTVVEKGPDASRDFIAHVIKQNKSRKSDDELFKLAYGGRAC